MMSETILAWGMPKEAASALEERVPDLMRLAQRNMGIERVQVQGGKGRLDQFHQFVLGNSRTLELLTVTFPNRRNFTEWNMQHTCYFSPLL